MNRNKLEIAYSIGVLITIPLILFANTWIMVQSTNNTFDLELRRKANLSNSIIASASAQLIIEKKYDQLQKNLDAIESSNPALMHSTIIVNENDNLKIIAHSLSAPAELTQTSIRNANLAISRKDSTASFIDTYDRGSNPAKAWLVMTPVLDDNENVIAVVSASTLNSDVQAAIDNAYQRSFIVLAISVVLIIVLLFRYYRLVGYIQLLAKQRELNQMMNDFLSVATHELKAPTTIIKGYLSNVLDGDFGPVDPNVSDQIVVALSQTDRLTSLVQDLLNVSRVDQGKIQYNITSVDTAKVINMIIENYRPMASEKGLELIYNPVENLPMVKADEGRVQEVFTNLIDNAIKYTAKGSVTITQLQKKDVIVTNFRDTGFGISPEAKLRLFQRFYRVKTSQTETISGTGLGLWIIKQYVEAMNGKIDVETMEGVGSNFIVELPVDSSVHKSV